MGEDHHNKEGKIIMRLYLQDYNYRFVCLSKGMHTSIFITTCMLDKDMKIHANIFSQDKKKSQSHMSYYIYIYIFARIRDMNYSFHIVNFTFTPENPESA